MHNIDVTVKLMQAVKDTGIECDDRVVREVSMFYKAISDFTNLTNYIIFYFKPVSKKIYVVAMYIPLTRQKIAKNIGF